MITNNKVQDLFTDSNIQLPKAFSIELTGTHLIEASAGTGKTWTLSALVVRFLLETNITPKQMIATTFTRAASAEMRQRIYDRIADVQQILVLEPIKAKALAIERADILSQYFLNVFLLQAQGDVHTAWQAQQAAHKKLKYALETFDEFFVGTLDSFCQKLLREFAFDTGQSQAPNISESEAELRTQLLHDALRQWRSEQSPQLIELLVNLNQLTDTPNHENTAGVVLNFLSAKLDEVEVPQIDFAQIDSLLHQLTNVKSAIFNDFFSDNARYKSSLHGKKAFYNYGHSIHTLCNIHSITDILAIDDKAPEGKLLNAFSAIEEQFKSTSKDQAALTEFNTIEAVTVLVKLQALRQTLIANVKQTNVALNYYLANRLRQDLPAQLNARGETSFAQQMRLLADVLTHPETGNVLAKQVLHRYPILMVDEFQDTNSDQDRMIASIYRNPSFSVPQQCLMLVGDPKQAIYGFRGGDVQTYLSAKDAISKDNIHKLPVNQRSIKPLVKALNTLFALNPDFGEQIAYEQVEAADSKKEALTESHIMDDSGNLVLDPKPLKIIHLNDAKTVLEQTAWHIVQLLQDAQQGGLMLGQRPVRADDIAVLCHRGSDLDQIQQVLEHFNVPVWRPVRTSVFKCTMASDLNAILQLWLKPYDDGLLRRVLSGHFFAWSLAQLNALTLEQQMALQLQFVELADKWAKRGFLAAWQPFANHFNIWQTIAKQPNASRLLVNLRHLLELLHHANKTQVGTHHLAHWLALKITSPRTKDSELERRLPAQHGVQLMTIHASKGLEFPIVFAPTLDSHKQHQDDILFYQQQMPVEANDNTSKSNTSNVAQSKAVRVIAFKSALDNNQDADKIKQHHARTEAESCRLAYVALTRAKNRLYLVYADKAAAKSNQHQAVLRHWLVEGTQALIQNCEEEAELLNACAKPEQPLQKTGQSCLILKANHIQLRPLIAWGATSFTAMLRNIDLAHQQASIDLPEHDQAFTSNNTMIDGDLTEIMDHSANLTSASMATKLPLITKPADARFSFARGAIAGNCLHQILEYLDPTSPHTWEKTFIKQMQVHGIKQVDVAHMQAWFSHIVNTPLPAHTSLASLGFKQRLRELEFQLSLKNDHINSVALLKRLKQSGIDISSLNRTHAVRYLKGAIDLIYQHGGKYYVADYKSNFLGETLTDYSPANIETNMHHSGYFLQASLYMVALHRYLTLRLNDYDAHQHLGGACYLYLRGMQASPYQTEHQLIEYNHNQTGIYYWQPDIELILDLHHILGQH